MVADGHYDNLNLWRAVPAGVILLARSAKNRVLYELPTPSTGRRRPAPVVATTAGWMTLLVRRVRCK